MTAGAPGARADVPAPGGRPGAAAWSRWVDRVSIAVLLGFLGWSLVSEAVRTGGLSDAALDDYAIARDLAARVVAAADYGGQLRETGAAVVFAYPPPDALWHVALGAAGGVAGPLLFMLAIAAAAIAGARGAHALLGGRALALGWAGVLLGVASTRAVVQSDLHLLNSNVLAAGLAVAAWARLAPPRAAAGDRRAEAIGGALLAASLSIKPFAAALVPGLLLRGRTRAVGWALGFAALAWIVAPAIAVGPAESVRWLASWLALVARLGGVDAVDRVAVDHVSLAAGLRGLGLGAAAAGAVATALRLAWTAAVVAVLRRDLRPGRHRPPIDGRRWLLIGATLLAWPVPMSAIAQPHHFVAAVPLAIVAGVDALAPGRRRRDRGAKLALLLGVFVLASYAPAGAARAFAHAALLPALLLAAWWPIAPARAGDRGATPPPREAKAPGGSRLPGAVRSP